MARAIKHIKAGLLNFDIIGTIPEHEPGRRRSGRCRPTSSAQQFYNDKCSWRACELQLAANFGARDLVLTMTYDDCHLPPDKQGTAKLLQAFFRKLRAARRRRGEDLRYIYVTEGWHGKAEDEFFGGDGRLEDRRLHHHVVLNRCSPGDLEEIRSLWGGGGYVRMEPVDVHYYQELAKYLTKEAREFGRARPGERSRRESAAWHRWYFLPVWTQDLRQGQLLREPFCQECDKRGIRTRATDVDHIREHKGDWALFTDRDNLQSLCHACHARKTMEDLWRKRRENRG